MKLVIWGTGAFGRSLVRVLRAFGPHEVVAVTGGSAPPDHAFMGLPWWPPVDVRRLQDGATLLVVASGECDAIIERVVKEGLWDLADVAAPWPHYLLARLESRLSEQSGEGDAPGASPLTELPSELGTDPFRRLRVASPFPCPEGPSQGAGAASGNLVLFVPYYLSDRLERQAELEAALAGNCSNPSFSRVIILAESGESPASDLLQRGHVTVLGDVGRLSYQRWLALTRAMCTPDEISILCNSDILFRPDVSRLAEALARPGGPPRAVCLSRYEVVSGQVYSRPWPHYSQDVWAIRAADAPPESEDRAPEIFLGKPGCDNRFAEVLHSLGFDLVNPCDFVTAVHLHGSGYRTYAPLETGDHLGPSIFVHPSADVDRPALLEEAPQVAGGSVGAGPSGGMALLRIYRKGAVRP
jgi:hypothetical protein